MTELFDNSWDTDFFGFRTGSLRISKSSTKSEIATKLKEASERYDLLYVLSEINDIKLLGDYERFCSYVDDRITFSKESNVEQNGNPDIHEFVDVERIGELYPLAYISGILSRFNMDKNIPLEKFKSLYRKMIDNSVYKGFADAIYVAGNDDFKGFVSVKKVKDIVKIGLIGVDNRFQGAGIGKKLINAVENYCVINNSTRIDVLTQAINTGALKFYESRGFKELKRDCIYHLWFNR